MKSVSSHQWHDEKKNSAHIESSLLFNQCDISQMKKKHHYRQVINLFFYIDLYAEVESNKGKKRIIR